MRVTVERHRQLLVDDSQIVAVLLQQLIEGRFHAAAKWTLEIGKLDDGYLGTTRVGPLCRRVTDDHAIYGVVVRLTGTLLLRLGWRRTFGFVFPALRQLRIQVRRLDAALECCV